MENKDKMQEMQAQIDMLTKLLGGKSLNSTKADSYIEFESLSLSPLYLSTEGNGKGELYTFDNFGDTNSIPLVDAKNIVRQNKAFIQNGLVYIKDEDFVNSENLKKYYDNIIDVAEMNNLLLCKRATFSERFSKLSKFQQETVCGLISSRLKDKKNVDIDVLFYINQLLGRDLKQEVENLQKLIDNTDE